MALRYDDPECGFHLVEVVDSINNEVFMNGGNSKFYEYFRDQSWKDIEQRLRNILREKRFTPSYKKACAWNALALAVRVMARQRQAQEKRIKALQNLLMEPEKPSWTVVEEMYRLRRERESTIVQLVSTQEALEQATEEHDALLQRLLQAERSGCPLVCFLDEQPEPKRKQYRPEEQVPNKSKGQQSKTHLEIQKPASDTVPDTSGATIPAKLPSILKKPKQRLPPSQPPISWTCPRGLTAIPKANETESKTTVADRSTLRPQFPPAGVYSPHFVPWKTMGQDRQVFIDKNRYSQERPEKSPKDTRPSTLEDQMILRGVAASWMEKKSGVMPQKSAVKIDSSHSIKDQLVMSQGTTAQENKTCNTLKEYCKVLDKMASKMYNTKDSQNKYDEISQENLDLENDINQSQKDPAMTQNTDVEEAGRSQNEDPSRTLRSSTSRSMNKHRKKHPFVKIIVKTPQDDDTSEPEQMEVSINSRFTITTIACRSCKAMNFSWSKYCFNCKKILSSNKNKI